MHDYFQILGVSADAGAQEIREAGRRRTEAPHPDFRDDAQDSTQRGAAVALTAAPEATDAVADVAIDFVDMTSIVDRMQAAFFARRG